MINYLIINYWLLIIAYCYLFFYEPSCIIHNNPSCAGLRRTLQLTNLHETKMKPHSDIRN